MILGMAVVLCGIPIQRRDGHHHLDAHVEIIGWWLACGNFRLVLSNNLRVFTETKLLLIVQSSVPRHLYILCC